jgi:catechol 2,3-dioxygenase-like lactoylglutathione lyase family enzyme
VSLKPFALARVLFRYPLGSKEVQRTSDIGIGVTMKLWALGAKVDDVDREVAFITSLGGRLILDEVLPFGDKGYRLPLLRFGDKYIHIGEAMLYEERLPEPLRTGFCHVVMRVDELGPAREAALENGAREVVPVAHIDAQFGVREVAFLRSPGGLLIELAEMSEQRVPEV